MRDHVIHLIGGRLANDTDPSWVHEIARKALQEAGTGGIVLHFHGGLVSYEAGLGIAERLKEEYHAAAGAYPIFFVWESDLLSTLERNFKEISSELIFRKLWKKLSAIVARKSKDRSSEEEFANVAVDMQPIDHAIDAALDGPNLEILAAAELPGSPPDSELSPHEQEVIENELIGDRELIREIERISDALEDASTIEAAIQGLTDDGTPDRERAAPRRASGTTLMDPRVIQKLITRPQEGARGVLGTAKFIKELVLIAVRVIRRYVQNRDHGLHATIIEEILRALYLSNVGEVIWKTMKQSAVNAFINDPEKYGGSALLESLRQHINPTNPPRITLVGHSAGSIFVEELLTKMAATLPGVPCGVVFLAPAATFSKTAYILREHKKPISGFRMFTMLDRLERKDQLVKWLYPSSLLYFISGVLEGNADTPLVGMQRFYSNDHFPDADFADLAVVRGYMKDAGSVVLSTTDQAPPGYASQSKHHGDFDNDQSTLSSVLHILTSGF